MCPNSRYAALTMVHQEREYLQIWLSYYEGILGRENLYIITHGGDPEIVQMASGCRLIYLPRLSVDGAFDNRRFKILNAYANFLLSQYDGLISGDVDELVFVDPALGMSLTEFAEAHRAAASAVRAFGMNIFQRSGEAEWDPSLPVLTQRRHARCEQDYCKPLIVFSPPEWSVGFHAVKGQPYLPDGLYLAHLHFFSKSVFKNVAKQRALTLAENEQIHESRSFRAKWWGGRLKHAKAYVEQMSKRPVEALDDRIGELRDQLRRNVVNSRWGGKGYTQMAFEGRQEYVLQLPERFGSVF